MYKYNIGLIAGRFQPFHSGHLHMFLESLKQCETLVVLLGSCNRLNSKYDPLTYDERKEIISIALAAEGINLHRIRFAPLVDIYVGNNKTFGYYIMNMCKFVVGFYPDVLISGSEPDRDCWIDTDKYQELEYLIIPRSEVEISATQIRALFSAGDITWHSLVPECLIDRYNKLLPGRI